MRWQVRFERIRVGLEESGEEERREEFKMCAPKISCDVCVLSNDRVTDVVLVSIGRYPVLRNPFKHAKPLTHRTLEPACLCVLP